MTRQVVASRMPTTKDSQLARLALVAVQYREQVGAAIRRRREQLGLTQAVLADRVEAYLLERGKREPGKPFDKQNISRWERGKNLGTTDNLEAVAHSLETTVGELLATVAPDKAAPLSLNGDTDEITALRNEIAELRAELGEFRHALGAEPSTDLLTVVSAARKALEEHHARPPRPSGKRTATG